MLAKESRQAECLPVRCEHRGFHTILCNSKQTVGPTSTVWPLDSLSCPFSLLTPGASVQILWTCSWGQTVGSSSSRSKTVRRMRYPDLLPMTTEQEPIPTQGQNTSQLCPPLSSSLACSQMLGPLIISKSWHCSGPSPLRPGSG